MIKFINDFRSSFPYKLGNIISGILSVITFMCYSARSSCREGAALLLLPILLVSNVLWILNIMVFFIFNINALVIALNDQIEKHSYNIFSDIGYLISVCVLFNMFYDYCSK